MPAVAAAVEQCLVSRRVAPPRQPSSERAARCGSSLTRPAQHEQTRHAPSGERSSRRASTTSGRVADGRAQRRRGRRAERAAESARTAKRASGSERQQHTGTLMHKCRRHYGPCSSASTLYRPWSVATTVEKVDPEVQHTGPNRGQCVASQVLCTVLVGAARSRRGADTTYCTRLSHFDRHRTAAAAALA